MLSSLRVLRQSTVLLKSRVRAFDGSRQLATLPLKSVSVRNTVFFDIDETICGYANSETHLLIDASNSKFNTFPHFKSVLDLLMSHNCEIAFFSAGPESRNVPLIDKYLSHETMFGSEKYEQLKTEGYFKVFSRHRLINDCKSLKAVMPDKSLDVMVLVDDYPHDEGPSVVVPWHFGFNTMYYLVGLFKDYFESVAPTGKTLRAYYNDLPKLCDKPRLVYQQNFLRSLLRDCVRYARGVQTLPSITKRSLNITSISLTN